MIEMKYVWDFVSKYFPNYYKSDLIAREGDLLKLVENEYEEGDCAERLLLTEYNGDINNPQIQIDHLTLLTTIYRWSIHEFIKQQD